MSEGGAMTREFTCELDGYIMRGESDDELVGQVERHIAEAHTDLVGKLSRDQILGMLRAQAGEEQ
jgi:predicted small metal-binding protein